MAVLHWADYLVIAVMIAVSMATGLYFACTGRKQRDVEEYLMAGRSMHPFPVAMSTFVTWMSAISFMGDPVEVYRYGAIYFMLTLGYTCGAVIAAPYATRIHRLQIVSIYEFLETKYSQALRLISSISIMVGLITWLGIATYAPALALSQACGIPVWASILILAVVCTFYVILGGMKAVIWTDTIQLCVMTCGIIAIVIQGSLQVGGLGEVMRIAHEGGRINFKESLTDFNPLSRASMWIFFFGGLLRIFLCFLGWQPVVQRFSTVPTEKDALKVAFLTMPMFFISSSLFCLCGLVMYAVYRTCDPLLNGEITRYDQMLPHLLVDLLRFLPGMPGLFLAAVFSASLSSMSSGMNSVAAMGLQDIVVPLYKHFTGKLLSPKNGTTVAKCGALLSGVAIMAFAFIAAQLGRSLFTMTALLGGATAGPTSGLFFIALTFPSVRSLCVHISYGAALAVNLTVGILAQIYPRRGPWEDLPLTTSGCPSSNVTTHFATHWNQSTISYTPTPFSNVTDNSYLQTEPPFSIRDIHQLHGLLYGPLGFFVVVIVSLGLHAICCCVGRFSGDRKAPRYKADYTLTNADENVKLERMNGDKFG